MVARRQPKGKISPKGRRRTTQRPRDERGRFLTKRQIAARKAAETRAKNARAAELQRKQRSRAAKAAWQARKAREEAERLRRSRAAKKGAKTRKARKDTRSARAKRAAETRERELKAKQRRSEAAKKAWARKKEAALTKALKRAEGKRGERGPSETLRHLFSSPRWKDSSWQGFEDGSIEAQLEVAAGPANQIESRIAMLEQALAPVIELEPVWIQVGVAAEPPKEAELDRYERHAGMVVTMTYARRGEDAALAFFAARTIALNLIETGFKVRSIIVRVTFGGRPKRVK